MIFVLLGLDGISQSTGWPTLVAIMGNWFKDHRLGLGLIMGVWSGN